jgi:hypothetical protein
MTYATMRPWEKERQRQAAVQAVILGLARVDLDKLERKTDPARAKQTLATCKEEVKIGAFCGGSYVKECTAQFGVALWQACRTCPD